MRDTTRFECLKEIRQIGKMNWFTPKCPVSGDDKSGWKKVLVAHRRSARILARFS